MRAVAGLQLAFPEEKGRIRDLRVHCVPTLVRGLTPLSVWGVGGKGGCYVPTDGSWASLRSLSGDLYTVNWSFIRCV
jgi:hypothetical protein